jgi:diacylglycerol kinase (ATP)
VIRFLVNPAASGGKAGRALERLRHLAAVAGAELRVSRNAEDLVDQARQASADGVARLLVAGGDGTFHHAVQGLAESESALGLIPLGRGNDLARSLGVPEELERAVDLALTGPVRAVDLGRLNSRYFGVYCGVGFDSEVAGFVHAGGGRFLGPLAYVYGVLRTLASFRCPTVEVEHDEGRIEQRALFVTVNNCPRFGGGMLIAPQATVDDARLDLVTVEEISRLQFLRVFPQVYRGTHVGHPAVKIVRTRHAHIRVDRELAMFADGEPVMVAGPAGVTVETCAGCLKVVS